MFSFFINNTFLIHFQILALFAIANKQINNPRAVKYVILWVSAATKNIFQGVCSNKKFTNRWSIHPTTLFNSTNKYSKTFLNTHPKNLVPTGPISRTRAARPSPSSIGGGLASFSLRTRRQVILVGMQHFRGGMMIRTPGWRHPRMAPPRASTMKLIRKLQTKRFILLRLSVFDNWHPNYTRHDAYH